MAVIETKYSVGDVVYWATTVTEKRTRPCPDCAGTKKWKAVSPAGGEYEFACPRCASGYYANRDTTLDYHAYTPIASRLTIGSIQVNTAADSYNSGNRYMCRETGIGSGQVYSEDDLYETEAEAIAAAQIVADRQNATVPHIVERFNQTLEVKDYQLDNATLELAKKVELRTRSMVWNIEDLFGAIEAAEDLDAVKEAVEDYKNYSQKRDLEEVRSGLAAALNAIREDIAELGEVA